MKTRTRWFVLLLFLPLTGYAFEEGFEFQKISPPVEAENPDKVEVVEMFFYGCPHCFRAEPVINAWRAKKPEFVTFKMVPAIFRESWEPLARAYYTAVDLGEIDRIHQQLFNAIHIKRQKIFDRAAIKAFFVSQGIDGEVFDDTYDSFQVATQVARARDLSKRYQIEGVPSFIVNGKWRTNGTMAGSMQRVPKVIDFLIRNEVAAQTPAAGG